MVTRATTLNVVRSEIDRFVAEQRSMCLWFTPRGYVPASDSERLAVLGSIEKHGDRAAFVKARELRDWLLQASSET